MDIKIKLKLTFDEVVEKFLPNLPPEAGVAIEIEKPGAEPKPLPPLMTEGEEPTITDADWEEISHSWETSLEDYNRMSKGKLRTYEDTEAFAKWLNEMSLREIVVLRKKSLSDIEVLKEVKREIEETIEIVKGVKE